jgi:hypothetical protein
MRGNCFAPTHIVVPPTAIVARHRRATHRHCRPTSSRHPHRRAAYIATAVHIFGAIDIIIMPRGGPSVSATLVIGATPNLLNPLP